MKRGPSTSPAKVEADDPRPLVLLLTPLAALLEAFFSPRFRLLKPWESDSSEEDFLAAHADSITAILSAHRAPVDARTLALLPHLGCVATTSVGVDHIDLDECRRRGIAVANVGSTYSDSVAEYAVGLLLDVLRRVSAADRYVRHGSWKTSGDYRPLGHTLSRRRVGILGLGNIGSLIAKMLENFGCVLSYNSRAKKPSVTYQYFPNAIELAAHNDILIVCCSLTKETLHIVGKNVLEALGKRGILINIGRGMLVDERELVRCLKEGVIAGAALDVFEAEPRVPAELFEMDNLVLTPHVSFHTEESRMDSLHLMARNLEAFFSGKPLLSPVSNGRNIQ